MWCDMHMTGLPLNMALRCWSSLGLPACTHILPGLTQAGMRYPVQSACGWYPVDSSSRTWGPIAAKLLSPAHARAMLPGQLSPARLCHR